MEQLLEFLYEKWRKITEEPNNEKFIDWLEIINPTIKAEEDLNNADNAVDTLDNFLISIIQENNMDALEPVQREERLASVWASTYAYCLKDNKDFENIIKTRGNALIDTIYPDKDERTLFYKAALSPIYALKLKTLNEEIRELLLEGKQYFSFKTNEEKIDYIARIIEKTQNIKKFRFEIKKNDKVKEWDKVLKWWLDSQSNPYNEKKSSDKYAFVNNNFIYIFNRALGSLISISLIDKENDEGDLKSKTGLPWIIFWIKDLITWGTLDPVVAYLMAKDKTIITRIEASKIADDYYKKYKSVEGDEIYNPIYINEWYRNKKSMESTSGLQEKQYKKVPFVAVNVELLRDFSSSAKRDFRVIPVKKSEKIYWFDPAGYPLASCINRGEIIINNKDYDYYLEPKQGVVYLKKYLDISSN